MTRDSYGIKPCFDSCKQGRYCRGICDGFKLHMDKFGESKYINNTYCKQCDKWFPKKDILMIGIYRRCSCCHMKVRIKRWSSKGSRGK